MSTYIQERTQTDTDSGNTDTDSGNRVSLGAFLVAPNIAEKS